MILITGLKRKLIFDYKKPATDLFLKKNGNTGNISALEDSLKVEHQIYSNITFNI
jgi:hypothetical protein